MNSDQYIAAVKKCPAGTVRFDGWYLGRQPRRQGWVERVYVLRRVARGRVCVVREAVLADAVAVDGLAYHSTPRRLAGIEIIPASAVQP
jgi:hypothetical protein